MAFTGSQASTKCSRRYRMLIEQEEKSTFVKFTIIPTSYAIKTIINLFLLIAVNIISFIAVNKHFSMDLHKSLTLHSALLVLSTLLFRKPPIETLTVLRNYGIQTSELRGLVICPNVLIKSWLEKTDFIPRDMIVDVIINEGFVRDGQVIFYLAVLVKEAKKLKLLFPVCAHIY